MKNALEEEIRKAQSQFERARLRNLQLKSALEDGDSLKKRGEAGRREEESAQTAVIASQSPSPPPFVEQRERPQDSPELFEQEDDSFKNQSFSPEPGLIEHIVSHSHSGSSSPEAESPPLSTQNYGSAYPQAFPMYPPPLYYPMQFPQSMPQFVQPQGQFVQPQGQFAQPQGQFAQPQVDMQGYARQMVDFFQQFLPQQGSPAPNDYHQMQQELAESRKLIQQLQGAMRADPMVEELKEELQMLQRRYLDLEEELVQTQKERDRAVALAANNGSEPMPELLEELSDRLVSSTHKTEFLEKTVAKEAEQRANAERRLEVSKTRVTKLETAVEDLKAELRNLHEEHTATTRDLTAQLKKAQKEVEMLRNELNLIRSQKEKLTVEREELSLELRDRPVSTSLEFYGREGLQRRATVSHDTRPALNDPLSPQSLESTRSLKSSEETRSSTDGKGSKDEITKLENELMRVQLDKDLALVEFNRIPEHSKTISQRRRREELEQELDLYTSQINVLKRKLRTLTTKRA